MLSKLFLNTVVAVLSFSASLTHCQSVNDAFVDETTFPSVAEIRDLTAHVGGLGLRTPASDRQKQLISWIETQLQALPVSISHRSFSLPIWKTNNDQTLQQAGSLKINYCNGTSRSLRIGGAIPYSLPTNGSTLSGPLIYVPQSTKINATDVRGKIVLRDFGPTASLPYPIVFAPAYSRTPDTNELLTTSYDRPYTSTPDQDLADAGLGGARGLVSMFNVPQKFIEGYYDPHTGIQRSIPGLYVGKENADLLKESAKEDGEASISVDATIGSDTTEEIFATLPGMSKETVYIVCHTDGNTWVQDNGVAATVALARYFTKQPLSTRNKTLTFAFTSGHLAYEHDGSILLASKLDKEYDNGDVALVIPIEHMGTREILPKNSASGAANGNDLAFSGKGELMVWCVGPVDPLVQAVNAAVRKRNLDRILVTRGASLPDYTKVPNFGSFGGIGTYYNLALVPTFSIISGPWSLWAPYFNDSAIDFDRLRAQTLTVADVVRSVDKLSKAQLAGDYPKFRQQRAAGVPTNTA